MKKLNFYAMAVLATLYFSSVQAMTAQKKYCFTGTDSVSGDDVARVSLQPRADVDSFVGATPLSRAAQNNPLMAGQLLDIDQEVHNVLTIHAPAQPEVFEFRKNLLRIEAAQKNQIVWKMQAPSLQLQASEFLENVHHIEHQLINMYDHACDAYDVFTRAEATKSAQDKKSMKDAAGLLIDDFKGMLSDPVFQAGGNLALIGVWNNKVCTTDEELVLVVEDRDVFASFLDGLSEIASLVADVASNAENSNREARIRADFIIIDKMKKLILSMDETLAKLKSEAFQAVMNSFWSEWKEQLPEFFALS